ncbi:hypothetical protein NC652_002780 [Populus alba x Populus x berolinensis]|nr:hypothetical protein NC652_002780 [Populus alba x Populus x berolinensis]
MIRSCYFSSEIGRRCEWFCTRNIDILVLGRIIALHNLILKDLMLLRWQKSQGITKHMDMHVQLMVLFDELILLEKWQADVFRKRNSQTDFILVTSPPAVIFSLNANGAFSMYGFCFLDGSTGGGGNRITPYTTGSRIQSCSKAHQFSVRRQDNPINWGSLECLRFRLDFALMAIGITALNQPLLAALGK